MFKTCRAENERSEVSGLRPKRSAFRRMTTPFGGWLCMADPEAIAKSLVSFA